MAGGIKITIGANTNPFAKGLRRVSNRIARWASRLPGRFARAGIAAGRRFAGGLIRTVKRGLIGAGALGAALIGKSISEAGRFEKYDLQFEALLGSATAAKKRMEEIKEVDLEVPFDITSITDASRVLTVFTGDAFAGAEALKMMADAASVTPNDIKDVAFWYGRAYSMIQSGRPFGEAAMRLQEMGLITGQARNEMERFSGVKNPRAIKQSLDVLNKEFLKFQGSAAKLAKTWPGIMSIFTSASKQAFAKVGDAILPLAKEWLVELIDKITELRNNGTLTAWGQKIANAADYARTKIEQLAPKVKRAISDIKTTFKEGRVVDAIIEILEPLGDKIGEKLKEGIENTGDLAGAFFTDEKVQKLTATALEVGGKIGWNMLQGMANVLKDIPYMGHQLKMLEKTSANMGNAVGSIETSSFGKTVFGKNPVKSFNRKINYLFNPLDRTVNSVRAIKVYIEGVSEPAKDKLTPPRKEDIP